MQVFEQTKSRGLFFTLYHKQKAIKNSTWNHRLSEAVYLGQRNRALYQVSHEERNGIHFIKFKVPTIVNPDEYKKRFLEEMIQYFIDVGNEC